ncbi:hypothetical protein V1512DRAFT_266781 [Lipomyces arxii]|uniref:uncharacterized protein n=1 Tax=Lipomyces arxii TaxID=56418 RepID=UPI0034D014C9
MSDQDRIIRERVSINEASYIRVAKSIQAIPSLRFLDKDAIIAAGKDTDRALQSYETAVLKFQLQKNVAKREIENYNSQKSVIEQKYNTAMTITAGLEEELKLAKVKREQVEEYNRFVKNMVETQRLQSRSDTTKSIEILHEEIRELEAQKNEYQKVWTARRSRFAEILDALQGMQNQIRQEKEEQDRREGMDEAEEGEIPLAEAASQLSQTASTQPSNGTITPQPLEAALDQDKMDTS